MIQTFLVNTDLKMRKGKIAAQTAHGETLYMSDVYSPLHEEMKERNRVWIDGGMHKIVFKSTELEMIETMRILDNLHINYYMVRDFGLTQVAKNSFTVLAVEPLEKQSHQVVFGHLKLL